VKSNNRIALIRETANETQCFASLTSFSSGAAQHDLGWVMVNLLVVPFLVLILIANLWLRLKPHRVDPETKVPV